MKVVKNVFEAERYLNAYGIRVQAKNIYLLEYKIFSGFLTSQERNAMYFLLWQGIDVRGKKFYLRADSGEMLDVEKMEEMVYKNHSLRSRLNPLYSGTIAQFPDGTVYTVSREIAEMQKPIRDAKVFLWEGISTIPTDSKNYKRLLVPVA